MNMRRQSGLCGTLLLLSLASATVTPAYAQVTVTWSGTSGADWNATSSWAGGTKPTSIDTALFNSNVATVSNTTADQAVASITFDTGAAATTVGGTNGRRLLLSSGGTITYASTLTTNIQTVNAPLTLLPVNATSGGSYTFTNLKTGTDAATSLRLGGTIAGGTTSSGITLTLAGVNSANNGNRISGVISDGSAAGGVALVKSGTGRWELTGNNTFTGSVSVNEGVLAVSGTALGSTSVGTTVASGATLAIIATSTAAEPVTLNGTGVGGTLGALSGGGVTFGGLVSLGSDATIKGNTPGNSIFTLSNTGTITGAGRTLTLDGNGQQMTVSSVIGIGSGNVVITGSAGNSSNNITLAGINTYSGTTFVQNGTLLLGASGDATYSPLGTADAGTVVSNGAKLNLNGRSIATAESLTLNGVGFGNEGVLHGTGTWGGPIVLATTSQIGGVGSSSNVTIATSSTVSGAGGLTLSANSGGGRIDGTLAMAGNLTKQNSGTWTLSGSNTYGGATSVSAGVLRITHSSALGSTTGATTVSSGATLQIDGSSGNLTAIAENITLTGSGVSNGGALRNIAGDNTITGNITASTTAPRINSDSGTLTLSSDGTYSSGNFLLTVGGAGNVKIDRIISSTQGVTKDGSGVLTMSRLNTFSGRTTIAEGVLAASTIGNSGTANPLGTNATVALGASTTTGTLRYTGSGETSSRGLELSGTTGSGGVIEANGSGPLAFTGGVTAATGDKTLTLAGTNVGSNSIGAIGDPTSGGVTSLLKQGVGRWVLTGASTFTGSTTIQEGELVLAANSSAGSGSLGSNTGLAAITIGSVTGSGTAALLLNADVTVDSRNFLVPAAGSQVSVLGMAGTSGTATFSSVGSPSISLGRDVVLQAASGGSLVFRNQWLQASGTSVNVTVGSVGNEGSVQLGQPLAATGTVRIDRGILSLVTKDPQDPGDPIFGSLAAASAVVVGPIGSVNAVLNVRPSGTSGAYVFGAAQTLSGIGTIQLDTNTPVSVAGFFSPGNSPGIFTFQGDGSGGTTTLSGTTFMEITGTTAGTTYDQVKFTSGALLNYGSGRLLLDLTGTYADNTQFQLFDFAPTASGSFTTISGSGSYGLLSFVRGTSGVWTSGPTTQPNQTFEFREATGTLVVVPEPATLALAAIGIGLAGWAAVRRRK